MRLYRCTNYGECPRADRRENIELPAGMVALCPEPTCRRPLVDLQIKSDPSNGASGAQGEGANRPRGVKTLVLVLLLAAAVIAGTMLILRKPAPEASPVAQVAQPVASSDSATPPEVLLRMVGSNTIGSQLGPDLAVAFLKKAGANLTPATKSTSPDETVVSAAFGAKDRKAIQLSAHGSATAFEALAKGLAEIGMSSRPVKQSEIDQLQDCGDMTHVTNEQVIGIDGIAVIVSRENPIESLTMEQLAAIFSGRITDWKELSKRAGRINLYARNSEKSGTFEIFQSKVLGGEKISMIAAREEDSAKLSDAVAQDPDAIGFVGFPFVRQAKPIAVAEAHGTPLLPTRFTIATEDYPLARRLYLYSCTLKTDVTRQFLDFVDGPEGQAIVEKDGFVSLTIYPQKVVVPSSAPARYRSMTAGTRRLSVNFRFRSGSKEFDNKAQRDVDRVIQFLADPKNGAGTVLLLGFADSTGPAEISRKLSEERAAAVADALRVRGITPEVVAGFGPEIPIASEASDEGRARNRRVEVWFRN